MADYWKIPRSTLHRRLTYLKMDIKDALTIQPGDETYFKQECYDHLGNKFASKDLMCQHWHISRQVMHARLKLGWSLEKALTTPLIKNPKNSKGVYDHMGQHFQSISEMCKHWGMTRSTYNARMKQGWSKKEALTLPKKQINITKQSCIDHKGIKYESLNAMCKAYNISHYKYSSRIDAGWSVEDALTKDNVINSIECQDSFGNTFPTKRDMANYYCIPVHNVQGKIVTPDNFNSLLIKSWLTQKTIGDVTIQRMITYPYFLVTYQSVEYIFSVNQILNLYHNGDIFSPLLDSKVTHENIYIKSKLTFPYYEITLNNETLIWTYWQIINYWRDSNFGLSNRTACH